MAGTLTKLTGVDLATVVDRAVLSPEALEPLRGCVEIGEVLARLEAAGLTAEAVRVMAHALPKREGVWWACMCAANTAPPDLKEPDRMARELAEQWVRQQKDEQRRAAMKHAEAGGFHPQILGRCRGVLERRFDGAGEPAGGAAAAQRDRARGGRRGVPVGGARRCEKTTWTVETLP